MILWARDLKISYFEVMKLPQDELFAYLEMRQLEDEYGAGSKHGIMEE